MKQNLGKTIFLFFLLYFFLLSIGMMSSSFKLLGKDSLHLLERATGHPIAGLLIGILTTSLVQSSSTVTSMVVGIVAGGGLDVGSAVPIIMGANIGTTVTNTIVSVSHITRKQEFQRAFAAATVHDFFNLICVIILLPVEIATGFLQTTATALSHGLRGFTGAGGSFDPVKAATKPVIVFVETQLKSLTGWGKEVGWIMMILSFVIIFFCLVYLTKTLKGMLAEKLEVFFDKMIGRSTLLSMGLGIVMTVLVQSSSITTSLLVPLAGAGVITLAQVFPVTLGANIGTTITALLASLGATENKDAALTIALCHLLFNLSGVFIIYPVPAVRAIPMRLAEWLAKEAIKSKVVVAFYLLGVFFGLPALLIWITSFFS